MSNLERQLHDSQAECEHLRRLLARCRDHIEAKRESDDDLLANLERGAGPLPHVRTPRIGGLSEREHEIACLIVEGLKPNDVAERLLISSHTVRNHLKSIYRKLRVRSMFEMVRVLEKGDGKS